MWAPYRTRVIFRRPSAEGMDQAVALSQVLEALAGGEDARAAEMAASLLRKWPDDASVQQMMATVALRQSRALDAERWALSSLARRPDHFATLMLAAAAARANGDAASARERYRRAAEADAGATRSRLRRGARPIFAEPHAAPGRRRDAAAAFPRTLRPRGARSARPASERAYGAAAAVAYRPRA